MIAAPVLAHNASIRTAAHRTGKLKIKYMVQIRQFRLSYVDAH